MKLSKRVRQEVIAFLCEGNDKADLADQLIDALPVAKLKDLLGDVLRYHDETGDAPYLAASLEKRS